MPDYTTKAPGVYIEEQAATGPIAGVGTSTAAFIGAAQMGPITVPTLVTNWTQFKNTFGDYLIAPRSYMAYAVRGFFDNGGTLAYIVRVGTAQRAFLDLQDRGTPASNTLRVRALQEGAAGNTIQVAVQNAQIVPPANNAKVFKARAPIASVSGNTITLQNPSDATSFASGDTITIEGGTERVQINRVSGGQILLLSNLTGTYSSGAFVRIADLVSNQKTFRIQNGGGIEVGSVLHLAQGTTMEDRVVDTVAGSFVTVAGPGLTHTYTLDQASSDVVVTTSEFTLVVTKPGAPTETLSNLSMDPRHSHYFLRAANSNLITLTPADTPSVQPPPNNQPAVLAATNLANGTDDNIAGLGLNQVQAALAALEKVSDVNIVCAPGFTDVGMQAAVVAHCESKADRFAILDAAYSHTTSTLDPNGVIAQRAAVESARGYAALYYPWIVVNDPSSASGNATLLVPPSGHMAGIFARSDSERGVHKAPANELITGAIGLERILDDNEHGELNSYGIDVLRIFPGQARPVVWGARTTAPKDEVPWRFVNVRRLFIFVEESIKSGIRWAVFEPNGTTLWKQLERTITEFLTRVWRSGALAGKSAAEAFYVKIDAELNPPSVQELGQIIIEIGIAPIRPAEFVIARISMWDGGSAVSEG